MSSTERRTPGRAIRVRSHMRRRVIVPQTGMAVIGASLAHCMHTSRLESADGQQKPNQAHMFPTHLDVHPNNGSCACDRCDICKEATSSGSASGFVVPHRRYQRNPRPYTHAALTRRLLVCGCPSVDTKRICLGAEGSVGGGMLVVVPLPPPFFWAEGWLIASEISTVVPEHWVLRIWSSRS